MRIGFMGWLGFRLGVLVNYLKGYRAPVVKRVPLDELKPILWNLKEAKLGFDLAMAYDDKAGLIEAKELLDFSVGLMESYIKQGGYSINE